jgi:hypothetical protein
MAMAGRLGKQIGLPRAADVAKSTALYLYCRIAAAENRFPLFRAML